MTLDLPLPLTLQLHPGQLLRWRRAPRAVELVVVQGRVWVTCAGDADDHFLEAGARFPLGGRRRVLIGGEGEARVALVAPPSQGRWRRPQGHAGSPPLAGAPAPAL